MRRYATLRLASLCSTLALLGAVAGCGDDTPARKDGGGGTGGVKTDGGDAGGSAGADAMPGDGQAGEGGVEAGGDVAKPCYSVTFNKPTDGAKLSAADDKDADNCVNGFTYDVEISTDAPNGTNVQLFSGNALLLGATVTAGKATFAVQLASAGETLLSVQFPSRDTCTAPTTKAKVTVDCKVPACSVSKPTISAAHPALNGIPAAQGGDRVSADGSPYQAAFEVTTDIEDNQPVSLLINNKATPATVVTVNGMALGGKATFGGVTLSPDATYEVQATCKAMNNVVGRSMKGTYPVDTASPDLTVSKPADGDFFGPGQLTSGKFQVCGKTAAADAVALMAGVGAAANNLCVAIGGSPECTPVLAVNTDACVAVTCPGGAPFDIDVTLNDAAGNKTTKTVHGVSCSSALPSVQIITPDSDGPTFTDKSKHLLSATAPQAFRDQQAATAGAQTDVIACSNRPGSARLYAGLTSAATLAQVGAAVNTTPAAALDGCPAGFGFVVRFPGVTLPESTENADGSLAAATRLRVDLTDASTAVGSSPNVDIWVDTVSPVISLTSPAGLCGSFHQAMTTFATAVQLTTNTADVTLTVTNGTMTDTYANPAFAGGVATFNNVAFDQGQSRLAAVAADRAGNVTALLPVPCTVDVGAAPVVVFTTPTSGRVLCASTGNPATCIPDANAGVAGWQGTLLVHATAGGSPLTTGNVTFTVGGTTLGTAALDSSGNAQLTPVTLLDGAVTITATTDNVPGRGAGSASINVVVDLGPPDAPGSLMADVLDRRKVSVRLRWTAPGDNGTSVQAYQVRYAKVPITAANFDDATVTTAVTFPGMPGAVGAQETLVVQNLYVENNYFFAVRAIDEAGNASTIAATAAGSPVISHLNTTELTGGAGANEQFGYQVDGSGDADNNGLSDLIVGSFGAQRAYLYLASMGTPATVASVVFSGDATTPSFGRGVAFIGDIDNDGLGDLAISARGNPARVFIYKGRATWPMTLSYTDANYVISVDATYSNSLFGASMARLGDFNGDGIDDFAIGANLFGAMQNGRVNIVLGRAAGTFTSFMLPDATRAIIIDADPAVNTPNFGYRVLGLGHYYSVTNGTTLIASAPGNTSGTAGSEGRLYAFHGQPGTAGAIAIASADATVVGNALRTRLGTTLTNLGPILSPFPSVGSGNPTDRSVLTGSAWLFSGNPTTGPFASHLVMVQSGGAPTNIGQELIGGAISGVDQAYSLIGGDALPDLVQVPLAGQFFHIIDGRSLAAATSPVDATAAAAVTIPFPTGWTSSAEAAGRLIPDINGDGYPDFAIANASTAATGSGRVVVYW